MPRFVALQVGKAFAIERTSYVGREAATQDAQLNEKELIRMALS
jgi:hypothetical protein